MALANLLTSILAPDGLRACSHGGGGPQVGEVPRLGGVTNLSLQSLFFFDCFHMRGGVPHLGGLPGQPCWVTRLGGVSIHVNAEGGVGWCLAGHLLIIKPIERLTGRLKMLNLMPNTSVRQD